MKSFVEIVQGIAERHDSLLQKRNEIDAEIASIEAQFGGIAKPKAKVKAKAKATEGAKRGRPAGSVNKVKVEAAAAENKRGPKPDDILILHVLPSKASGSSVSRQGCTAGLEKHGWVTKSAKKDTVVGQALTRLRNKKLATIVERGQWALSAAGERMKEKMLADKPKAPKVKVATPAAAAATTEAAASEAPVVLSSVPFEADAAPAVTKA